MRWRIFHCINIHHFNVRKRWWFLIWTPRKLFRWQSEREAHTEKKHVTIILPSHRKQFRSTDNSRKTNLFSANLLEKINFRLGRTTTHNQPTNQTHQPATTTHRHRQNGYYFNAHCKNGDNQRDISCDAVEKTNEIKQTSII